MFRRRRRRDFRVWWAVGLVWVRCRCGRLWRFEAPGVGSWGGRRCGCGRRIRLEGVRPPGLSALAEGFE